MSDEKNRAEPSGASAGSRRLVSVSVHVDKSACGLPDSRPLRRPVPTLTAAEREAILFCVSCAQDYRNEIDTCDDQGRERWDRATRMIDVAAGLACRQRN